MNAIDEIKDIKIHRRGHKLCCKVVYRYKVYARNSQNVNKKVKFQADYNEMSSKKGIVLVVTNTSNNFRVFV